MIEKEFADTLVIHAHLFTMKGEGVGYVSDGALAIQGTRIAAVDSTETVLSRFTGGKVVSAAHCAVLPGLINAHVHTMGSLSRGVAQDVRNWMLDATIPYFFQMTPEMNRVATRLSLLEGLRSGTTTFCDYEAPESAWGAAFEEVGVRAKLAPMFNAVPFEISDNSDDLLYSFDEKAGARAMDEAFEFARNWNGAAEGRITTMLGLQAPDMLPLDLLRRAKNLAQREGLMLNVHLAQGERETEQMLARYGKRSVELLGEIGYLDEQLLAVHMTDANDEEAERVAKSGASLALCSGAIGIIDGIVPPAHVFRQAGGAVGLGNDGANGNNSTNIFNEMKLTALFNKIKFRDPTVMAAWDVMRMATIEGAQAIGMDHCIGSLEAGKEADLIVVDLNVPHLSPTLFDPVRNLIPNLVYSATGQEIKHVMVAGRMLMEDYKVTCMDEQATLEQAREQGLNLDRRVKADPSHRDLVLLDAMNQGKL